MSRNGGVVAFLGVNLQTATGNLIEYRFGHPALLAVALLLVASTAGAQSEPARLPELLAAGNRALTAADLTAAAASFERAVELEPGSAESWLGLATVREQKGALLEALSLARQAEPLAPKSPQVLFTLARLLAALGRSDEAIRLLDLLEEVEPGHADAAVLTALVLRDRGARRQAIEHLERAIAREATSAELYEELAFLLLGEGDRARAAQVATAGRDRFPGRARLELAAGLALAGDAASRAEAVASLERAIALGLDQAGRAHLELGRLLIESGRAADAVAELEAARLTLADEPEVYYRLGVARRQSGDLEGARATLERFAELNRERDAAEHRAKELGTALNEAQSLATASRLPEALVKVNEVLAEDPEAAPLALRAKILFSMGQREEALLDIAAAGARRPGRVEYHYLEGLFLMHLGRAKEAIEPLRRAVTLDPDLADAHALLGMALAREPSAGPAARHLGRALELGADGAELRLAYAEVLAALGRSEESESQREAYRRLANR